MGSPLITAEPVNVVVWLIDQLKHDMGQGKRRAAAPCNVRCFIRWIGVWQTCRLAAATGRTCPRGAIDWWSCKSAHFGPEENNMAAQSWTVIDVDKGIFEDDFAVHGSLSDGMPDGWSVKHQVLRGGKSEGVSVVELNNGRMTTSILPTRGMGIWKVWLGENELGWRSPANGPVHPSFVPVMDPGGLGGGWKALTS